MPGVDEVRQFARLVNGRAGVIPLVETYKATQAIDKIVGIPGVSEVYIGLNDLHLDMKLNFMFEPLADGLIDELAGVIKSAGMPFGFGGIARVGEGVIPGELVLAEHLRLVYHVAWQVMMMRHWDPLQLGLACRES